MKLMLTAAACALTLAATASARDLTIDIDLDEEQLATAESRIELLAEVDEAATEFCVASSELTDGVIIVDKCRVRMMKFFVENVEDERLDRSMKKYMRSEFKATR
ncbi:UrcA family protein [Parvularcula lutaonensis]|uniref:UrcA family protein n=1 Tax=Parvularcula lutaonensis TaxID=491923 RepID=A0ABV7MAU1_9PROT|nr:UrcA family protein [Parvularcula lutaonensis]GGY42826.1 hypothetical protein GCM10007148_09380 [Parvularcula lutaonensis]